MQRHILLIYNPAAGTASLPEMWLGTVIHRLSSDDRAAVTVARTEADSRGEDLLKLASHPPDLVVVAGGDGSVRLMLAAAAKAKLACPVGILPLGTGNQLARNLGIYRDNLFGEPFTQALETIFHGVPTAIDLGIMNGQYFSVACGAGPMSDAILLPGQEDKTNWKILAYASSLIQTLAQPPAGFQVTTRGESFKVAASGIFVSNVADLGIGKLSETARINDGYLDLCILNPRGFSDYLALGFKFAGGFVESQAPYYVRKVKAVTIDVAAIEDSPSRLQQLRSKIKRIFRSQDALNGPRQIGPVTAMIDGERCDTTPMHIEVAPRAVSVMIPPDFELPG